MTNEQLRLQMLAGIITENEYKAKLDEIGIGAVLGVAAVAALAKKAYDKYKNYSLKKGMEETGNEKKGTNGITAKEYKSKDGNTYWGVFFQDSTRDQGYEKPRILLFTPDKIDKVLNTKLQGGDPDEDRMTDDFDKRLGQFTADKVIMLEGKKSLNEPINYKMTNEQLRMQMLSGIITESEYKEKLESIKENEPQKGGGLQLKNAAMKVYSYIKKNGFNTFLTVDGKNVGDRMNYDFSIQVLTKSGHQGEGTLVIQGNRNKTNPQVVEKLQNDIIADFPFLKKSNQSNPSQLLIKLEVDPKANVSESLNEGEVTVKDVEDRIEMYTKHMAMLEKTLKTAQDKIAKEKKKAKPNQYNIEKHLEDVEFAKDEIKKDKAEIKYDQKRLEKLKKKESLNEHFIAGGIVGIGAITQIPSRAKTDYEMAFEYFLGERYETKFENREQDLKEGDDEMPPAPSHEETDANQVYEMEGEDVMPKFRRGVLKQLIAYAEESGSSQEAIQDLKDALARIEAEIEAEKNKKPLPR